jgi:hypothetical protein
MSQFYLILNKQEKNLYLGYDYLESTIVEIISSNRFIKNELIQVNQKVSNRSRILLDTNKTINHGIVDINKLFDKIIILNSLSKFNNDFDYLSEFLARKVLIDEDYLLLYLDESSKNLTGNNTMYNFLFRRAKVFFNEKIMGKWFLFKVVKNNYDLSYRCISKLDINTKLDKIIGINKRCEVYYNYFSLNYHRIFNCMFDNNYIKGLMPEYSINRLFDIIFSKYSRKHELFKFEEPSKVEFAINYETLLIEDSLIEYIKEIHELEETNEQKTNIVDDLNLNELVNDNENDDLPF